MADRETAHIVHVNLGTRADRCMLLDVTLQHFDFVRATWDCPGQVADTQLGKIGVRELVSGDWPDGMDGEWIRARGWLPLVAKMAAAQLEDGGGTWKT